MIYLILTIIMNIGIFLSFRSYSRPEINTFNAIVVNYLVCVLTGIIFYGSDLLENVSVLSESWILFPVGLGAVFILTFFLMAITTQKYNVAVATVSSKMSMLIPVVFSIYVFKLMDTKFDIVHFTGLLLGVAAIILCSFRSTGMGKAARTQKYLMLIPGFVFLASGFVDTSLNYINAFLITSEQKAVLPEIIFASAFIFGLVILVLRKERISKKDLLGGIYLGIPNYFSLYFLLLTLSSFNNNGAVVYPILNIGIIVSSSMASYLMFKEKLIKANIFGMILAVFAILLISYQDIIIYFS
jgi:multidrug transporter EmrE-like cation transporter